MLEAAGLKNVTPFDDGISRRDCAFTRWGPPDGPRSKTSVLNGWNQVHTAERVRHRRRVHDVGLVRDPSLTTWH
jgi:hypothetical protein